jgi:ribosomal protein L37AE/L43A
MATAPPRCKSCSAGLELRQTCLKIFWHCPACGEDLPLEAFPERIDDAMEERLANVRCNRI